MKILVRKYINRASIEDAIVEMNVMGIYDFKATEIIDFDAGGPCSIEIKKYKVKGGRIISEKDIITPSEFWPPYQEIGGGIVVEVKLKVKFECKEKWVKREFKKYSEKHAVLSDYPERFTKITESESVYADEDTEDGYSCRWVAGVGFERRGRKVIVSRYDYCM